MIDGSAFPAFLEKRLGDVAEDPSLENKRLFHLWAKTVARTSRDQAVRPSYTGLVRDSFSTMTAMMEARLRSVELEAGESLIRHLREEVLEATSEEATVPSQNASSWSPSWMASEIQSLDMVLTSLCKILEARVVELNESELKTSEAEAAEEEVNPVDCVSSVIVGKEKAGRNIPPGVINAAPLKDLPEEGQRHASKQHEKVEGKENGEEEGGRKDATEKRQEEGEATGRSNEAMVQDVDVVGRATAPVAEVLVHESSFTARNNIQNRDASVQCGESGKAETAAIALVSTLVLLSWVIFESFSKEKLCAPGK